MNFYRVALTFHPNQANPSRPSGRGVWRVARCWPVSGPFGIKVFPQDEGHTRMYLDASRAYKVRSRVDPRKVLGV
jgi:hypothetical protein